MARIDRNYTKEDTKLLKEIFPDWNYFVKVAFSHIPRRIRELLFEWDLYSDIIGLVAETLLEAKSASLSRVMTRRLLDRKLYSFLKEWGFRKVRHPLNGYAVWRIKESYDIDTSKILYV